MVASAATRRIRLSPPRGMARSMNSFNFSKCPTASRSSVGTSLHGVARQAARVQLSRQNAVQGGVRVKRLLAAAEDDRVARLDAQGRGIDGDVRPRLVEEEDDPERDADLLDFAARSAGRSPRAPSPTGSGSAATWRSPSAAARRRSGVSVKRSRIADGQVGGRVQVASVGGQHLRRIRRARRRPTGAASGPSAPRVTVAS